MINCVTLDILPRDIINNYSKTASKMIWHSINVNYFCIIR